MAKKKPDSNGNIPFVSQLASLMKEVGILGFILIMVVVIFLWYGDETQKKEFIDKFILFKDVNSQPFPFGMVVFALIMANVIQHLYYTMRLGIAEKETKRLAEERTQLQEVLLNRPLKSSVSKK